MSTTVYTYNDKVLVNSANDKWLKKAAAPIILPANTVRVRTSNGNPPVKMSMASYETATLVTGTTDIYDVYKSGTSFKYLLYFAANVVEVIAANTTGITNMNSMFMYCSSLTTVPLFDTSSATDMGAMFSGCTSLTSIPLFDTSDVTNLNGMAGGCTSLTTVPLFDTSSATDMRNMFSGCTSVQSGALALYQQASGQTTPPEEHEGCFYNCGSNTVTGAAELAQIPSSWGGTAS